MPADGLDPSTQLGKQTEDPSPRLHGCYAELCKLENLQLAYAQLKKDCQDLGVDTRAWEAVESNGVQTFLRRLSADLQARTYHPATPSRPRPAQGLSPGPDSLVVRDQVVQAALILLLGPVFPAAPPCASEPDKAVKWVAGVIDKGLSRVYAVNLNECLDDAGQQLRLVERASRRLADPELIGLLKEIVAAPAQPDHPPQGLLTSLLADIAFEGIDHILQQAKKLGREENVLHLQGARFANELVIFLDQDPRYEWLWTAVQERLREELSNLHYDLAAVATQAIDLTRGEPLRLLGYELRSVTGRQSQSRVHYQRLEGPGRRQPESTLPRRRRQGRWHYQPLRWVQACGNWIQRRRSWQLVRDAYRKVISIKVGWRHLPITLCPVLLLYFGWRSPLPWLCFLLVFLCNWQWTLRAARRRWPDVVLGACALAALSCLFPVLNDIYASRSHEVAAPAPLPSGFYTGQYHSDSWWNTEPASKVPYGLYLPPHLAEEKGPLPLLVFLHDYGQGTPKAIFRKGLPAVLATRLGTHNPAGRFDFVVFCPIDPTGQWQPGSQAVEGAMQALDYVMGRHHIDPARVYLTGIFGGGDGVWRLAEAYPDKWAALAPVSSSYQPDVPKVRHIPAWIFAGPQDKQAPMQGQETLLQELQKAQSDVRYTAVPNKQGATEREAYRSQELYDWLASKKKG